MSDEEVKAVFVDFWNWWDKHRKDFDKDKAYEEGIELLRKHQSNLAAHMFVELFRQMERRTEP